MYVSLESLSRLNALARADLQGLHDTYFNWLLASTFVVFLGVLAEGPEVIRDLREEIRELFPRHRVNFNAFSGMPIPEPRSRIPWKSIATVGWALVFAGVIGEGIFEGFMTYADTLAEDFNNLLLKDAQDSAVRANERVLQLSLALERERQRTAYLTAKRELSNAEVADLATSSLTSDTRFVFTVALCDSVGSDPEPPPFRNSLLRALGFSGDNPVGNTTMSHLPCFNTNVDVSPSADKPVRDVAKKLADWLNDHGRVTVLGHDPRLPDIGYGGFKDPRNVLVVRIGPKQ